MSGRFALQYALCIAVFALPAPAQRQRAHDAMPLPEAPDELVALLAGEHLPTAFRKRAIPNTPGVRAASALMGMKDDAVPALTRGMESDDYRIRLNAVYVLDRINTPATLPARIKAASDAHPQVRAQAVSGLPAYNGDEAHRALLKALKDPDSAVRNAAAGAFRPRDEKALPGNSIRYATAGVLIPLLDDPATQYAAADTLGRLGMNIAARPLLKLLKAEDKEVRWAAVQALGRLKDKQVAVELAAAMRDEDAHVRMYAAGALGELGDLRTTPALVEALSDREVFVRRDAAGALGRIGDLRAVPSLLVLLEDPDEWVRASAADALGQIGDVRAVEPLCRALARDGRETGSVARALGRLRDPRAIEALTRCLLGPEPRPEGSQEAATALAQIRHPDSVAALVKVIINTGSGQLNTDARRALGELTGVTFYHEANEKIAEWWNQNREEYYRGIPEKK